MNPFQELFDRQKRHFATGVTRSRGWRVEQRNRMSRLVTENEAALQQAIGQDFKTASDIAAALLRRDNRLNWKLSDN